jgi:hypothetical protein
MEGNVAPAMNRAGTFHAQCSTFNRRKGEAPYAGRGIGILPMIIGWKPMPQKQRYHRKRAAGHLPPAKANGSIARHKICSLPNYVGLNRRE